MISSTSATRSTRSFRITETMDPTVFSSLRAGSTTLTVVCPLAATSSSAVHWAALLVRRRNQARTRSCVPITGESKCG